MALINDYNRFVHQLHLAGTNCQEGKHKNIAISPYAIQAALGLIYEVATGDTEEELRKALCVSGETQSKADFETHIGDKLAESQNNNIVLVNKIYLANIPLAPTVNRISSTFHIDLENVEFNNSAVVKETVNNWITEKTNNEITNYLDESNVFLEQEIMMITALHVESRWSIPFGEQSIKKMNFSVNESETVQLDSLCGVRPVGYSDIPQLHAKGIRIDCKDNHVSLVMILPNMGSELSDLQKKLGQVDVNEIANSMRVGNVILEIPKFRFESYIDMPDVLKELGVSKMFSDSAELPGLSKCSKTKITKFLHKIVVDINENGISTKQTTDARMPLMCCPIYGSFAACRPFWFAIREKNNILITGRFMGK